MSEGAGAALGGERAPLLGSHGRPCFLQTVAPWTNTLPKADEQVSFVGSSPRLGWTHPLCSAPFIVAETEGARCRVPVTTRRRACRCVSFG